MSNKRKVDYHEDSSSEESRDSHKVDLAAIDDDSSEDEGKPVKKKIKKRKIVESDSETTISSSSNDSESSDSDFDSEKPCSSKNMFSRRKSASTTSRSSKRSLNQKSTTSSVSTDLFSSVDEESSDELNSSLNNKNNNRKSVEELEAENRLLKEQVKEEKSARAKLEQENKKLRAQLQQSSSGPGKSRLRSVYEGRKIRGPIARHKQLNGPWDPKNPEYVSALSKIKKIVLQGKEKWKCPLCEHISSGKRYIYDHIANIHFNRQFPCSSCDIILTSCGARSHHIKQCHSGKRHKFTGVLPTDLKVLELLPEDNEVICRSVLEENDRDFLYDHWLCRYLPNPISNEPPPHLYASGYAHRTHRMTPKSAVNVVIRHAKKVDHSKNNKKKRARNGCENYKKMKKLGFELDSSTAISCGVISIGEKTADEVKPIVRESVYATYSRNHLDSLDMLNAAAAQHIESTLKDYIKEGEAQRTIWNTWAKENIHLLVMEALNTNKNNKTRATISKIIDHIERTRLVGATFLQPDIENYLQNAVQDKSILAVDGQFKINI